MNLWAKRTGQLLLAALFLMSCEDDSFVLGFKNETSKFNLKYREFNIGDGTVISIDSVVTDNNTTFRRLLIGEEADPIVGTTRSIAFAEFLGDGLKLAEKADHEYIYDSAVVHLHLDYYSYGLSGNGTGRFNLHRITEQMAYAREETYTVPGTGKELLVKVPTNYYTSSTVAYDPTPMAELSFKELFFFDGDERTISTNITLERLKTAKDTLVAAARLPDEFGQELFDVVVDDANSEFSDITKFRSRFRGFAFVPEEANAIYGFNPSSSYSRVKLYYHSQIGADVVDTLSKDFVFNGVSFNNITTTRAGGLPPVDPPYTGVDPGSLRVVQSGNLMITKIDLNNFYNEFADVIEDRDIVINSAEIVIESVDESEEYTPLPFFELRVMEEDDDYLNYRTITQEQRDSLAKFYVFSDSRHYYVSADIVQSQTPYATNMAYSSSTNKYTGAVTLFIQNLFERRNSGYRPRYLGIYPAGLATGSTTQTPFGKTVDRSVFNKENIKLRVYYTEPNKSNL